ncbi:MAG: DNA translocase FtsK [Sphingobacteriales bacterium]|nr:DNA translocase FtsK [Sphingobacteriales bacterium]
MAIKASNIPENTFRDEKKAKTSQKKKLSFSIPNEKAERIRKLSGLFILTFAIILFSSFISFLFTWKMDQSLVKDFNSLILSFKEIRPGLADNHGGLIGAYLSYVFMAKWFGISAFFIVFILIVAGIRLFFDYRLLPFRKTLVFCLFSMFWLSTTLGLLFYQSADLMAGGFGIFSYLWLNSLLGIFGTVIVLLFAMVLFLILMFNVSFKLPKRIKEEANPQEEKAVDEAEPVWPPEEQDSPAVILEEEDKEVIFFDEEEGDEATIPDEGSNTILTSQEVDFEIERGADDERDVRLQDGQSIEDLRPYDPTLELSNYKFPPLDLLNDYSEIITEINQAELEERKNMIVQTLRNYNIEIEKIKATVGSTVTLYEIIPAAGIRISKIKNLEDDIALSLSALGIRIIAPIPGKGTIGIEVPNTSPEIVSIKSVLSSAKFQNTNMELPFAMGKTISNDVFIADLTKMPHLLIAGATGQGKSVGLNVIITSLLYKKHPSQVKFVLVDPKKVELSIYSRIEKHFMAKLPDSDSAIITDISQVIDTLHSLTAEMDERYLLLRDAHVRNIVEYNKKFIARQLNPLEGHRYLPYIVLVVDELADLMMTAGKEVEMPIARLAQLARAIGIHLILATQRPSVNIITGTIKANFPARIAFKVSAAVDSRTIIDSKGAEQLIGRGDMLFSTGSDTIRIQCAFIDTPEIERVVEFIADQPAYPQVHTLPQVEKEAEVSETDADLDDIDPLFEDAARIVVQHQQGSTSLIQRRLKLGYNRAGRIIDQLESAGIVGPFEGSKARAVLIPDEFALEQFLRNFRNNS